MLLKATFKCPDPQCRLKNFNCAKCFLKQAQDDFENLGTPISSETQPYEKLTDEKLIAALTSGDTDWSCAVWRLQNDNCNG